MSLLVRRCLSRSHQLEEYVDDWQIDHKEAMDTLDWEELVKECLELASLLQRAWHATFERAADEQDRCDRVLAGEQIIRGAINRTVRMFSLIGNLVEAARRTGRFLEGAEEFLEALRNVKLMEKQAERDGQPFAYQPMEESLAAFGRGEVQSAEDMLRELREPAIMPPSWKVSRLARRVVSSRC